MDNIEIIYDELKQNQIHIDQRTLAFYTYKHNSRSKQRYVFTNTCFGL